MAKTPRTTTSPLIDVVRPLDADGPLFSLICSTYGLSLDQPNFFEQDFLPTVLGLGGLRDRGYAVPVALERRLKEVYSALVADSHALAEGGRPSLQIDVLPVGHRTNHAKVVLIHRKRLIRLVIAWANLTHEGYRRQREVAAVLDFKEGGRLPVELLRRALAGWSEVMGELSTEPVRKAFDAAVRHAEGWTLPKALPTGCGVAVVFGGGAKPLWQDLIEAWPRGEPLLDWCICSPCWPDATGGETPFEVIARGLAGHGARVEGARLHIITCADSSGGKARPKFPFQLARRLYEQDFPIRSGYVAAARLEAVREEIPEGMAEDQRELHAKWVLLRGPTTAVILMGSANFTRKGLGVLTRSEAANIEACVLLTLPAEAADPQVWMPPLAEEGIIDLAAFQENQFQEPVPEENDNLPWSVFIARIEIEIRWQDGPDPVGAVRVVPRPGPHVAFAISLAPDPGEPRGLLPYCKWVAERKGHAEWYFEGFKHRLLDLYKELIPALLRNKKLDLPLVIADEAHHLRHAQRTDCQAFRRYVAPLARRLQLWTATPFQLHRDELLEVLATGDSMKPAIGADRVEVLKAKRDRLAAAMNASEAAGRAFSREWGALAEQTARLDSRFSATPGQLQAGEDPRTLEIETHWGGLRAASGEERKEVLQHLPGALRPFFTQAVQLHDANLGLQAAMTPLIIRHQRRTQHRRYWVGREYPAGSKGQATRPDRSQLHLAPGQPMPPHGELAQYLLMKVVAEMSRGRHRTTLGMDLTGCYTTLWQSREGSKAVETALQTGQHNLLNILKRITGHGQKVNPRDADHPKVETVVAEVLRRWDQGEKSLIFCFRVPTAETLYRLISRGVDKRCELRGRPCSCPGVRTQEGTSTPTRRCNSSGARSRPGRARACRSFSTGSYSDG